MWERARRVAARTTIAFAVFVVAGNGVILLSTWYFQSASAGAPGDVAIDNFRWIDDRVARGAAPSAQGLRDLAGAGVTTVVDLRAEADLAVHDELLDDLGLTRFAMPVRDGQLPTEDQAARFMAIVDDAPGPVFLHCGAGVGRTGAMTAFYLNRSGQAEGTGALRRILAVGPPSLEQIAFSLTTVDGEYERPGAVVTATSRLLDAPRRIWHNLT